MGQLEPDSKLYKYKPNTGPVYFISGNKTIQVISDVKLKLCFVCGCIFNFGIFNKMLRSDARLNHCQLTT